VNTLKPAFYGFCRKTALEKATLRIMNKANNFYIWF